ncbi:extracellular calcium-sensing receptor-like [Tachysurus fulvidraco]|uniref:extracellular calcium-sensing receptor-like n=1 Tax=Tachysurus fulvidraco TaxID=1234273 RepID=UPI001FEFE8CD|nr:extracellular calcium-sensing receptor-like [Tachysurus fulvidraco]
MSICESRAGVGSSIRGLSSSLGSSAGRDSLKSRITEYISPLDDSGRWGDATLGHTGGSSLSSYVDSAVSQATSDVAIALLYERSPTLGLLPLVADLRGAIPLLTPNAKPRPFLGMTNIITRYRTMDEPASSCFTPIRPLTADPALFIQVAGGARVRPADDGEATRKTGFACKLLSKFEVRSMFKEGDIMIGGIFPVSSKEESILYSFDNKPQWAKCNGFGLRAFRWTRTMMFAIDEINQDNRLLPNISLGYIILDSCSSPTNVLRAALTFMSTSEQNGSQCHPPPILAVIAESSTTQSLVVAGAVGPFKMPLVSYFATCECLSDKTKYPTFFRTIPSDYYQAKALAFLVRQYGWTWIGVIMSDSDYGLSGISAFRKEVEAHGVCIAFVRTVLRTYSQSKISEIAELIKQSTVKMILAFASERDIDPLMKEVVKQNITGIQWIGSEAWVTAASLSTPEMFKSFGGTLGLVVRKMDIPKLGPILKDISPYKDSESSFVSDFWEALVGCRPQFKSNYSSNATKMCSGKEEVDYTNKFFDVSQLRIAYNVYQGVYAIAHALHQGMFCEEPESNFSRLCLNASQLTPNLVSLNCIDAFIRLIIDNNSFIIFYILFIR